MVEYQKRSVRFYLLVDRLVEKVKEEPLPEPSDAGAFKRPED